MDSSTKEKLTNNSEPTTKKSDSNLLISSTGSSTAKGERLSSKIITGIVGENPLKRGGSKNWDTIRNKTNLNTGEFIVNSVKEATVHIKITNTLNSNINININQAILNPHPTNPAAQKATKQTHSTILTKQSKLNKQSTTSTNTNTKTKSHPHPQANQNPNQNQNQNPKQIQNTQHNLTPEHEINKFTGNPINPIKKAAERSKPQTQGTRTIEKKLPHNEHSTSSQHSYEATSKTLTQHHSPQLHLKQSKQNTISSHIEQILRLRQNTSSSNKHANPLNQNKQNYNYNYYHFNNSNGKEKEKEKEKDMVSEEIEKEIECLGEIERLNDVNNLNEFTEQTASPRSKNSPNSEYKSHVFTTDKLKLRKREHRRSVNSTPLLQNHSPTDLTPNNSLANSKQNNNLSFRHQNRNDNSLYANDYSPQNDKKANLNSIIQKSGKKNEVNSKENNLFPKIDLKEKGDIFGGYFEEAQKKYNQVFKPNQVKRPVTRPYTQNTCAMKTVISIIFLISFRLLIN